MDTDVERAKLRAKAIGVRPLGANLIQFLSVLDAMGFEQREEVPESAHDEGPAGAVYAVEDDVFGSVDVTVVTLGRGRGLERSPSARFLFDQTSGKFMLHLLDPGRPAPKAIPRRPKTKRHRHAEETRLLDPVADITYDVSVGTPFRERLEDDVGKTPEALLAHLQNSPKHCTRQDIERALEAYGFTLSRRRNNKSIWQRRSFVFVMHEPHKPHVKAGVVAEAITIIELAEQAGRDGNGSPK